MPLTDISAKSAKPKEKLYKLSDEKGLFLSVRPNGGKYWQMKYRFDGKEKILSFGVYPEVSLKEAREKRDSARKQIKDGVDPFPNLHFTIQRNPIKF
jgi:Arm DNA-binding domain